MKESDMVEHNCTLNISITEVSGLTVEFEAPEFPEIPNRPIWLLYIIQINIDFIGGSNMSSYSAEEMKLDVAVTFGLRWRLLKKSLMVICFYRTYRAWFFCIAQMTKILLSQSRISAYQGPIGAVIVIFQMLWLC